MNVLLSIKPKYVDEIKKGNKKYEFRKSLCREENYEYIKKIFIYSSAPIKKIVGRFLFNTIIKDHPKKLWDNYKDYSGIEKKEFFKYFGNKEKGLAIEISDLKFFNTPIDPHYFFANFVPPQSFCYIKDIEAWEEITNFL